MTTPLTPPRKRGLAAMDAAKVREITSKGGQAVAPEKRTFSTNRELAAEAGRRSVIARRAKKAQTP